MNITIQHGENVLVGTSNLPEGDIKQLKSVIVGHSETGHHHVLNSSVAMNVVEVDGVIHIEAKIEAQLSHNKSHDKHDTLIVPAGTYCVRHKSEYNPVTKAISRVFD